VGGAHGRHIANRASIPAPGRTPTLEQLHEFAGERLARYKLPKSLVLVEDLPRNVTGKVSRDALKQQYAG